VDASYGGSETGSTLSCVVAAGAGQTMRWEQENIAGYAAGTQSTEAGATTVTMSQDYTFDSSNIYVWLTIGIGVKPVAAGGGLIAPPLLRSFARQRAANY
jgi:hypothetical protein